MDEGGIPDTAEGRVAIAERIARVAAEYGLGRQDLVFDPLAMAVSADKDAARQTLRALKLISSELGAKTSLGISNISFGLPGREHLNSTFLSMALEEGLSAAIMNPYARHSEPTSQAKAALLGEDDNFEKYISFIDGRSEPDKIVVSTESVDLKKAIIKGMKDEAKSLTQKSLLTEKPLDIVNNHIIPALNTVGDEYEKKIIYLPNLLMSAEAAGAAFECIKAVMPSTKLNQKSPIILATVKGDIHDIGKNIVKLILENYGFYVIDLGKDVSPERILDEVLKSDAKVLGLSALMTTTLPAMEETVRLVRKKAPSCKIMVGGAVLCKEYANEIGADFYGRDAISAVKYVEGVNNN